MRDEILAAKQTRGYKEYAADKRAKERAHVTEQGRVRKTRWDRREDDTNPLDGPVEDLPMSATF